MSDDDLFVCPAPYESRRDDRHVCDSVTDFTKPFLDDDGRVYYPLGIIMQRCAGCGRGLAARHPETRWAWYVIEEEKDPMELL